MSTSARTMLSPNQIAALGGFARESVVNWIKSGELVGYNFAAPGKQPRYLVDVADWEAFKLRRRVVAPPKRTRRAARRDPGVIEFY